MKTGVVSAGAVLMVFGGMLRTLEKEQDRLEAEEAEMKRQQSNIPKRIRARQERIDELKAQQPQSTQAPVQQDAAREGVKPTVLEDLAAVMEENRT